MFEHSLRESKADESMVIYELATSQTPEGKDFYLYMGMTPTKYEDYKKLQGSNEPIVFSDFGTVILTGWGREPAPEVKAYMEAEFGMRHTFEDDLMDKVEKIRHDQENI